MDVKNIQFVIYNLLGFIFLFLAYSQLKYQPFYSIQVNNYRFGVYLSLGSLSLYTLVIYILKKNSSQIVADVSIFFLFIIFFIGYYYNNYYFKKSVNRVYKRYTEKVIINNLRKNSSDEELDYNPEKMKKLNAYQSIERITEEKFVRNEIKVFKNYYECEFACRFVRNNRDIDAFNLMKKLFEEGINQFKHESDLYIIAWFYINSMRTFYKENNLLQKYDKELFNADYLISIALELKLGMRKKYLINLAESYMEMMKRENLQIDNSSNNNIEDTIKFEDLKHHAITLHIMGLKEIMKLFDKLKSSTNPKDVVKYGSCISKICKFQNSAYSQYRAILRQFPETKDILYNYIPFLIDVMSKEDEACRYSSSIPNRKNSERSSSKVSSNDIVTFNVKKVNSMSSNSISSVPFSEDYSIMSGLGKEIRKKLNYKNTMIKKFISPIKDCKFRMNISGLLFIIIFAIQTFVNITMFNFAEKKVTDLNYSIIITGSIMETAFHARMISSSIMTNDDENYKKYKSLLQRDSEIHNDIYINSVSKTMDNYIPQSFLIVPVGEYSYDTVELNPITDSYRKLIANLQFTFNREMLNEKENITDILYEPHFRYFIVNSKSYFDNYFGECLTASREDIEANFTFLYFLTIIFDIILSLLAVAIAYTTFVDFKKLTNKTFFNVLRTFRFISKDHMEEIINNYNKKIEILTKDNEIDKNAKEETMSFNKFKNIALILSFIIIFIFIVLIGVPVLDVSSKIQKTLALLNQSSDRHSILKGIQMYTYEVLNNDRSIFVLNEPIRIINNLIYKLEKNQKELKNGLYGGPTFEDYPSISKILKENGCYRIYSSDSCDSIIYNSDYGFSKELGTLPINELIMEYLYYVKNFISDVEDERYVKLPFTNKENIKILFDQELNDNFFKLQDSLMDNMIGAIQYIDQELINYCSDLIENKKTETLELMIIGIVTLIFIDLLVLNKIFEGKVKEMKALVSFVFLIPSSIVNKNDKYKRFLETSQFEDY
ncbi:hypothetical protein U3516DRAFT_556458 [Neocallimastix sp. 'constans']